MSGTRISWNKKGTWKCTRARWWGPQPYMLTGLVPPAFCWSVLFWHDQPEGWSGLLGFVLHANRWSGQEGFSLQWGIALLWSETKNPTSTAFLIICEPLFCWATGNDCGNKQKGNSFVETYWGSHWLIVFCSGHLSAGRVACGNGQWQKKILQKPTAN